MSEHSTPPLGVRYRRALRQFGQADVAVRVLTVVIAAVLLADVIGLGGIGGSTGAGRLANSTGSNGVSAPGGGPLEAQPGATTTTVAGATTVTGPSGSTTGGGGGSVLPGTPGTTAQGKLHLTASDRGVSPTTIKVVFPWPNLGPVGKATGLDTSSEDAVLSIKTYVNDVNARGGINGRTIDAQIVEFNPLDAADMRSKCLSWTQDQQIFAVVDSIGWFGDNQLCITQEGHLPLISGWTAVPLFTQEGNPNLWWTGPDNSVVVQNLVHWAVGRGVLKPDTKFGIVAADRQEDVIALNQYLLPALHQAGLKEADIESSHFDSSDGADSAAQAPSIVARLRAKGVTTVIPLLPFFNLASMMNAMKSQNWNPVELLSDYETGLTAGLGLADSGYANADNQVGPTSYVLGSHDDTRGYTPQGEDCYKVWQKSNPGVTPPPQHWLEATGTAMTWCQNIRLFAQAATAAGPMLTRAGFDAAMMHIAHFPGTVVPDQSFGPNRRAGPHEYRTVQIHENGDKRCPKLASGKDQGSCWLLLSDWQEMTAAA
ncbi:MAG: ABC transporter substrate-binding protein [Acidimicrobiales bacterium]